MAPVMKFTKSWLKHKVWELESKKVPCTFNLMGNLNAHSTSEESGEDDSTEKTKVSSPFKIKIRGPKESEPKKKRKPRGKKRSCTLKIGKSAEEEELEKAEKEDTPPEPKRTRTTRVSKKKG